MGARAKSGKFRGAAQQPASKPPVRKGRNTAQGFDSWEPQLPDEGYDELECQRIVLGEGRSLPLYYDDYN